jgi:hypothetical protein
VIKARLSDRRTEGFGALAISTASDRSIPPEIREGNLRSSRETRLNELRRQYVNGTYYVPAAEISAALIEKHLKR